MNDKVLESENSGTLFAISATISYICNRYKANNFLHLKDFLNEFKMLAFDFGMYEADAGNRQNVVIRCNMMGYENNYPYFAFISPDENDAGPYSDLSLVFFPNENNDEEYLMALGVGS